MRSFVNKFYQSCMLSAAEARLFIRFTLARVCIARLVLYFPCIISLHTWRGHKNSVLVKPFK